ncbi:hypothetical protein GO988_06065 [Hymenobacter sp. HMF4947]|uniref:Uncharacterized protein n=1 Tax=Hymenobacter ginkgonis TaxID=2682976 RepID=A0A7K1TBU9_9BACT|nr:hypothetical protein [Hymenobacter ginkgonis]MVN75887.1 hypothetical protein [Hymenobacter ginkgonis]
MHSFYLTVLLGVGLLGTATEQAAAQATETHNLATDTIQPANAKYHFPVSRLGTAGGKQLFVFITSVSERGNGIEFTWRHPLVLPRPKPVFITSEQLQWVELSGRYYEPVRLPGESAHGLALRLQAGPKVELFDVATPKKGVPIPVPGAVLWTGVFSSNYNHAWYLRRPGQTTMLAVPEGKKFAPFLANYLADSPDLAAAIRATTAGHRYDDVPQVLARYNQQTFR